MPSSAADDASLMPPGLDQAPIPVRSLAVSWTAVGLSLALLLGVAGPALGAAPPRPSTGGAWYWLTTPTELGSAVPPAAGTVSGQATTLLGFAVDHRAALTFDGNALVAWTVEVWRVADRSEFLLYRVECSISGAARLVDAAGGTPTLPGTCETAYAETNEGSAWLLEGSFRSVLATVPNVDINGIHVGVGSVALQGSGRFWGWLP